MPLPAKCISREREQQAVAHMDCWAKTMKDGRPGITPYAHNLYVALVFAELLKASGVANSFPGASAWALLAAWHDLGKVSQGFLCKCPAWLVTRGIKNAGTWATAVSDHSRVSQFTVRRLLLSAGLDEESASIWACVVGAHHGRHHGLHLSAAFGMKEDAWETERRTLAQELAGMVSHAPLTELSPQTKENCDPAWVFAGLLAVADWIGSDEYRFPADRDLDHAEAARRAAAAVEQLDFTRTTANEAAFPSLFGFAPNSLQSAALEAIREPGVYVIEAPMGMGKTEAALAVAHRLIAEGKADGFFFGLPTRTTSDRIHERAETFVARAFTDTRAPRLIHGTSWMHETTRIPAPRSNPDSDESHHPAYDWFASARRALLAPFGVGTADQALLAVVAAKHFAVRRYALVRKVLILDEVHSYDRYTGTLIRLLAERTVKLGGTVLILSATLTARRRAELLGQSEAKPVADFPLISGKTISGLSISRECSGPAEKSVSLRFVETTRLAQEAIEKAECGACVLWICDTVDSAQETYARLKSDSREGGPIIALLHSRFTAAERAALEARWLTALGKPPQPGEPNPRPPGCILVSTQIVEQSVDIDADLLVTELAPADMLLQRIGRLWRHPRTRPDCTTRPECLIVAETETPETLRELSGPEIVKTLGSKAFVYAPYALLRTLDELVRRPTLNIPSDIRSLLEATYADRTGEPSGWSELRRDAQEKESALIGKALVAADIWNEPEKHDEEGVATRLNDRPTVDLILFRDRHAPSRAILLDGSTVDLTLRHFDKPTAIRLKLNTVSIPRHLLTAERTAAPALPGLLCCGAFGARAASLAPDGEITEPPLKPGYSLRHDPARGLIITRPARPSGNTLHSPSNILSIDADESYD